MKATIEMAVGQESGFIYESGEWFLENWSSNLEEYSLDGRKRRKIKNVLRWLVNSGAVIEVPEEEVEYPDEYDELYQGKYYKFEFIENANPVSCADLDVEGLRVEFDDFIVIAPDGWN